MGAMSAKQIRGRIRSMESTRQLTGAMELVAAAKLRRAQEQVTGAGAYVVSLMEIMGKLLTGNRDLSCSYFKPKSGGEMLQIVIAADRGLAGGYNSNILRYSLEQAEDRTTVLPIGKKAWEFCKGRSLPVLSEQCIYAESLREHHCAEMAKMVIEGYLSGRFYKVQLIYTDYRSVFSQQPVRLQLLPLQQKDYTPGEPKRELLWDPDADAVLEKILPVYIAGTVFGALCKSRAAEQAARRVAMDAASRNADDMLLSLQRQYHKLRQAAVTQELTQIVSADLRE